MYLRLTTRELVLHPGRTVLAVTGVAVATAMLVDMLMLGGGLRTSFRELLRTRGYELRVSPKGTLPFDTEASLSGVAGTVEALEARPGVRAVAPVLAANLFLGGERVFVLGVDPAEQGVYRLVDGRPPATEREAVVSVETGEEAGLSVGDSLELQRAGALASAAAGRTFRISGRAEFLYAARGERPVAVPLGALQDLADRPDRASFLMVALAPDVDPETTAEALRELLPAAEVASVSELVARAETRLSYFRQLSYILGAVSLVVTVLLVGTIMSVSISQRYGTIAALRAIGISRRSILTGLGLEGLALCAVAGLAGLGLGVATARWLEGILAGFPGLPRAVRFFVLRPSDLLVGYVTLLVAGLAASLLPAWRAASLDIARTLHDEGP